MNPQTDRKVKLLLDPSTHEDSLFLMRKQKALAKKEVHAAMSVELWKIAKAHKNPIDLCYGPCRNETPT